MTSDIVKFLHLFYIIYKDYLFKENVSSLYSTHVKKDLEGFRTDTSNSKVKDMLHVYMLKYNGFLFNKSIKELPINTKS